VESEFGERGVDGAEHIGSLGMRGDATQGATQTLAEGVNATRNVVRINGLKMRIVAVVVVVVVIVVIIIIIDNIIVIIIVIIVIIVLAAASGRNRWGTCWDG
jgi:hypothetical protein